ncbi:hypothetical protein [Xanthovirga aplysinae]|uniref:hypothetical protein n=1 Tax=Xanthovirga aplysinae TaxID=2529853 RepID=UPI0012BCFCE3|nr:hypothetical protein [Xanthovirga aplysinae]MTI32411.1 hypothetical protein [Xanthovirga aplysinae]
MLFSVWAVVILISHEPIRQHIESDLEKEVTREQTDSKDKVPSSDSEIAFIKVAEAVVPVMQFSAALDLYAIIEQPNFIPVTEFALERNSTPALMLHPYFKTLFRLIIQPNAP